MTNVYPKYNTRLISSYNEQISVEFRELNISDTFDILDRIESNYKHILHHSGRYNFEELQLEIKCDNQCIVIYTSAIEMVNLFSKPDIFEIIDSLVEAYRVDNFPKSSQLTLEQYNKHVLCKTSSTCETCSICMDDMTNESCVGVLKCGHEFHNNCIKEWLMEKCQKPGCPLCRKNVCE